MRDHVRSVVDITVNDISDDDHELRFLREGYDIIVYSEKRWPFYEVAVTFEHRCVAEGLHDGGGGKQISVSSMTL